MKIIPVDKNALLNDLSAMCIDDYDYEVCSEVFDMIDQAPVLDYAPVVHAKWEICSDGYYPYCSNCRQEPDSGKMSKYCPNCGAIMDKEAEKKP